MASPSLQIRVYVGDDQPMFRDAVVEAINEDPSFEVVGSSADGRDAAAAVIELAPDVAVLDLGLRGLSGRDVLDRAVKQRSRTRVLFLSSQIESDVVFEALAHGAAGYLSKTVDGDAIRNAIAAVAQGETVLSVDVQKSLAGAIRGRGAGERGVLTSRELAVLVLVAEGLSTREVATRLGVAAATVKTHLQGIFAKLEAPDRTSAVASAMRRGLLD